MANNHRIENTGPGAFIKPEIIRDRYHSDARQHEQTLHRIEKSLVGLGLLSVATIAAMLASARANSEPQFFGLDRHQAITTEIGPAVTPESNQVYELLAPTKPSLENHLVFQSTPFPPQEPTADFDNSAPTLPTDTSSS